MTGTVTQKHSKELEKNITMKLGYANAKIWKCDLCGECAFSASNEKYYICDPCDKDMTLVNHVSFVDCPGHNALMATMLNGTCVLDYTILVESAHNKEIPAPQTVDHLIITKQIGTPNYVTVVNKLDLVNKSTAKEIINNFKNFLEQHSVTSPIIPISANFEINLDILCKYMAKMKIPTRDLISKPKMIVIRSFNVNMPGIKVENLKGGVIGGSIVKGILNKNDKIILKPGFYKQNTDSKTRFTCYSLSSQVLSIFSDKTELKSAQPGGLIAVQLSIDPALSVDDNLSGNLLLHEDIAEKYNVYEDIAITYKPIKELSDYIPNKGDTLVINSNGTDFIGIITKIKKNCPIIQLNKPMCCLIEDKISLSRKNGTTITIVGFGIIEDGYECSCN